MFIAHIHQFVQKHSRLAFLLIGGAIIVPFVFIWGSPNSGLRLHLRGGKAGTMYGKAFTAAELQAQQQAEELSFFLRSGNWLGDLPQFRALITDGALRRMRALRAAEKLGLATVGKAEVAAEILRIFDTGKGFNQELFNQVLATQLKPRGIDGRRLDTVIRDNIVIRRLETLATAGLPVPPAEVKAEFNRDNTTYATATCRFEATKHLNDPAAKPAPEQVRAFFLEKVEPYRQALADGKTPEDLLRERTQAIQAANRRGGDALRQGQLAAELEIASNLTPYYIPEKKQLRIAVFPTASSQPAAAARVDAAAVKVAWEREKDTPQYQGKEFAAVQAEIRATLLKVEMEKLTARAAQQFGDAIYNEMEKGLKREAAVARFTQKAAAENVKVLGTPWVTTGEPVPPFSEEDALAQAAAKLTPETPLSETVRGKDAYYVAILVAAEPGRLPTVDDPAVAKKVGDRLARENALRLARDAARKAYGEIQPKLAAGAAFATARGTLAFRDAPPFSRREPANTPDGLHLLRAVPGSLAGRILPPVAIPDGALLIYVKQVTPPAAAEFAGRREEIRRFLAQDRQSSALETLYARLETESDTQVNEGRPR
ncbi:MAG: SurA N-terminal domain-containing protein [Lentisphaeria bacterium]|jgi:hypothetical protein